MRHRLDRAVLSALVGSRPRWTTALVSPVLLTALGSCYQTTVVIGDPIDGAGLDGGSRRDGAVDARSSVDGEGPTVGDGSPIDAARRRDAVVFPDTFVPIDADDAVEPPPDPPPDVASCRIVPTIDPFDGAVMEKRWPPENVPFFDTSSVQVCATPVIADLDPNDGEELEPVVVFTSYAMLGDSEQGILRIWNPRTDETISYPTESTTFGVLEPSTNLAAADLDGDGRLEIVGLGVYAGTYAFRSDGTLFWESPYPTAVDRGLRFDRTIGGAITIADLEGDGVVEVIAGRNVLDGATGALRFVGGPTTSRGANASLGPISCVADLDQDGVSEVIAGRSVMRADGSVMWINEDAGDGFCAVADIMPASPGPEVILVSRGYLNVLNGLTGATLWYRVIEGRGTDALGGPPTVADFDGDGAPEIGVAHGSAYGVYDPTCVGPGNPVASCGGAGVLWVAATEDTSSSATGSSVFDFNGDGRAEVVYNDQFNFRIYDGLTGLTLLEERNSSRTRTENPVIADVDSDGDAEIIFTANNEAFFLRERYTDAGVEIWGDRSGRWVGARRIWNQHAYHITNVDERGRIPRNETASWTGLNAYRQNRREGGDVLVTPDLWGGRGRYECVGPNRARIAIDVANYGLERVGAGVVIGFYRGAPPTERVGETRTVGPLDPNGGSETVTFDIELDGTGINYYARLDDPTDIPGGAVNECRENNNDVLIWRPRCN